MRRLNGCTLVAVLVAACALVSPTTALAGGVGNDTCPAGTVGVAIPNETQNQNANAATITHIVQVPAGRYAVVAEGDSGSGVNPYVFVCGVKSPAARPIAHVTRPIVGSPLIAVSAIFSALTLFILGRAILSERKHKRLLGRTIRPLRSQASAG